MAFRQSSPHNDRLVGVLRSVSAVQIQNSLMRRTDREIALGLSRMEEEDREFTLSHLPAAKAERVRDEIRYQKRLKITEEQYARVVGTLVDVLTGNSTGKATRSYIRPKPRR